MNKTLFAYAFLGLTSCIAISSCGNRQSEAGANVMASKDSSTVDEVVEVVEVADRPQKAQMNHIRYLPDIRLTPIIAPQLAMMGIIIP